jgi:hypothetical protein
MEMAIKFKLHDIQSEIESLEREYIGAVFLGEKTVRINARLSLLEQEKKRLKRLLTSLQSAK